MIRTNTRVAAGKTGPRITTGRKIKTLLALVGLLGAVNMYGVTIPIYDTGGFEDPSNDRLHPTDRSQRWLGASDLSNSKTLAESFSLQHNSVLDSVELWTYDTKDGSAGTLQQIQYAIYTGATQPTGAPLASGLGQITSSVELAGHRSSYAEGDMVIQTVFNLVTPFHLAPDVIYWLALTACTDPLGVSCTAQWAEAGSGAVGGTYLVQTDTGWVSVAGDRAFELEGHTSANVPETGSTLAFLVLAMLPLAGLRWMARKTLV